MAIGNFFQVLGVQPTLGRLFTDEEVRGGPHPVALLTNAYWRRQFMADQAIVGKAIEEDRVVQPLQLRVQRKI